jgi:uncharacterized repeat protein (TIGR01451 family)
VAVTKIGSASATLGGLATYTLRVTNSGPSTATNVTVFDQLPAGFTFASALPAPASTNGGLVRWPLFNLPAFASSNFSLTVTATSAGVFTNIAYATNSTPDPDATNNNGTRTNSQAITLVQPLASQFGVRQGPNVLNPQNGLFEQRVTVTNVSSTTVAAFRMLVGNIRGTNGVPRTDVTLVNATGTNVDSRPYVQYNSAVDPGSNVTLILEFFVPDRKPFTNSLEVVATLPAGVDTNAAAGVVTDRAFMDMRLAEPRFVIEWTSVPGTTYTILYSDGSPSGPWFVATPTVTAMNNRVQWYDEGPPKTASKPASVSSRYYRIIANP